MQALKLPVWATMAEDKACWVALGWRYSLYLLFDGMVWFSPVDTILFSTLGAWDLATLADFFLENSANYVLDVCNRNFKDDYLDHNLGHRS